MRRVILFLLAAAILIALGWWLFDLPGTVSIVVGDLTMSAPTPVALLAVVILFVAVYIVFRIIAAIVRLPRRTRRLKLERRRQSGDAAVTRTLVALAGGDTDGARSAAQRARAMLGDTPQTLLLAAYAARQAGDGAKADETFGILTQRKDAAFLGYRGLYQGAVARGDWEAARALVEQAAAINPRAPWLTQERQRLAIQSGSWKQALAAGAGSPNAALMLAAAEEEQDKGQARRIIKQAFRADPAFTPAALAFARSLRAAGKERAAQGVLRQSWAQNPHPQLGALSLDTGGFMSRESRAAWLTESNPDHPESLLLKARAALDEGHLDVARTLAEKARDAGFEERRLWLLLADIAHGEGDEEATSEALRRAASAQDSTWRCEACGAPQEEWHARCGQCGEVGKISWGGQVGRKSQALLPAGDGFAILP
jgi:HemY protein